MGEVKTKGFELPNKKITVRFIKKKKGLAATVDDNHVISGGFLEGAYKGFCVAPLKNGALKNVLTKEEKKYFEKGPYKGLNLSVYGDFWREYQVKLYKTDKILDLSLNEDYLDYKLLLGWDKIIAPSLIEYNKNKRATYQFIMIESGEEIEERGKELGLTKQAWKHYAKYEDNKEILTSVISLMTNKKISENSDISFIKAQVEDLVDRRTRDFVNLVEDSNFETKRLIALAINAGIVIQKSGRYETIDGLKLAHKGEAATLNNAVRYLNDGKNQEIVDLIKVRLQNTKE